MKNPRLAVVAFPGNNCETETLRAARRNGFTAELVRWNQPELIGGFDAYILPGGFSFEDRGRSGAIAAREPIFDALRLEAQKGKVILGICNGAQMIVESGLIPIVGEDLALSLAENIRRDQTSHVLGTGYYNAWCQLKTARKDTAFTHICDEVLSVPIAHGEGRFATQSQRVAHSLSTSDDFVAFRYCDEAGRVATSFPTTPNGALGAVAMIVNQAGTVGAIMPHPERFYTESSGDQILASMRDWIEQDRSPKTVQIGDLSGQALPEIGNLAPPQLALLLETKLIITDNEAFSVSQAASQVVKSELSLEKSVVYEISGEGLDLEKLSESGLIFNSSKEQGRVFQAQENQVLVESFEDDGALELAEKLSNFCDGEIGVRRFKAWDFGTEVEASVTQTVLKNGLLCNPHAGRLWRVKS